MRMKLMVITQSHEQWPARGERAAGQSYNLVCQDMTHPAEDRMTENILYRLKDEEKDTYWNKSLDKVLEVACRRIAYSKTGKATLVGNIIELAK